MEPACRSVVAAWAWWMMVAQTCETCTHVVESNGARLRADQEVIQALQGVVQALQVVPESDKGCKESYKYFFSLVVTYFFGLLSLTVKSFSVSLYT